MLNQEKHSLIDENTVSGTLLSGFPSILTEMLQSQQGSIARVIGKCSFPEHLKLCKFSKKLLFGTLW
jgi:hypothetical protein